MKVEGRDEAEEEERENVTFNHSLDGGMCRTWLAVIYEAVFNQKKEKNRNLTFYESCL